MIGGHYLDINRIVKGLYINSKPSMYYEDETIESIVQTHRDMAKYIGYNERDLEIIKRNLSECRLQDIEIHFI